MKWIKYKIVSNTINIGTEKEPIYKDILITKKISYCEENLEIAQAEAYEGKYSIVEDDMNFEKKPIRIEDGGTNATSVEGILSNLGLPERRNPWNIDENLAQLCSTSLLIEYLTFAGGATSAKKATAPIFMINSGTVQLRFVLETTASFGYKSGKVMANVYINDELRKTYSVPGGSDETHNLSYDLDVNFGDYLKVELKIVSPSPIYSSSSMGRIYGIKLLANVDTDRTYEAWGSYLIGVSQPSTAEVLDALLGGE